MFLFAQEKQTRFHVLKPKQGSLNGGLESAARGGRQQGGVEEEIPFKTRAWLTLVILSSALLIAFNITMVRQAASCVYSVVLSRRRPMYQGIYCTWSGQGEGWCCGAYGVSWVRTAILSPSVVYSSPLLCVWLDNMQHRAYDSRHYSVWPASLSTLGRSVLRM